MARGIDEAFIIVRRLRIMPFEHASIHGINNGACQKLGGPSRILQGRPMYGETELPFET